MDMRWPVLAVFSDERITKWTDRTLDVKSEQWTLNCRRTCEGSKTSSAMKRTHLSPVCCHPSWPPRWSTEGDQFPCNWLSYNAAIYTAGGSCNNAAMGVRLTGSYQFLGGSSSSWSQFKFFGSSSNWDCKEWPSELYEDEPPEKRQKHTALNILLLSPDVNSSTILNARDEFELYMSERHKRILPKLLEARRMNGSTILLK